MLDEKTTRNLLEKRFTELWVRLRIQRHITLALSKKQNSKQALERADHFLSVTKLEIIEDITQWHKFKPSDDATLYVIDGDLIDRINGELAKIGVPFIRRDVAI